METSNCAAPAPQISQPPPPRQARGRRPARGSPRQPAKCAPATPRLRPPGAPQGLGTGGVPGAVQPRAEFWGTPHWAPARPSPRAAPDPRREPAPRPHDGRAGRDPGPAYAPPCPRGRPEGTARRTEGGTEGLRIGRPLPTSVRASVAPAQPSRRSRAPSSARPAPAAAHARHSGPRHPPTRGRPRAAPAAGRAAPSAAGAGERERASAERARNGHEAGTERARSGRARERGEREGAGRGCGAGAERGRARGEEWRGAGAWRAKVWDEGASRGRARVQGAGQRAGAGGWGLRGSSGRQGPAFHFKKQKATNTPRGDVAASGERPCGNSRGAAKILILGIWQ